MNALVYRFDDHELCVTLRDDGEPLFRANQVCAALGVSNSRDALARLDDDERGVVIVDTPGGKQEVLAVTEAGLYSLTLSSRKPQAKRFRRWAVHEVFPAIRKTGKFEAKPAALKKKDKFVHVRADDELKALIALVCRVRGHTETEAVERAFSLYASTISEQELAAHRARQLPEWIKSELRVVS